MKKPIAKSVIWFDTHTPEHEEPAIKAALEFLKDYKPNKFILGGDCGEWESVSHWIAKKQGLVEGKRINKDFEACNKLLDRIERVLPRTCSKVFMLGNHEDWVKQYVEDNPSVDGLVSVEKGLGLVKRHWEIVDFNKVYRDGKLWVTHGGWYNCEWHTKKHVQVAAKNIVYGHYHQYQAYSQAYLAKPDSVGTAHMAVSSPCLSKLSKEFLRNKPTNWLHGFVTVEHLSNGAFNLYVIIINKGMFSFNGKIYSGNQ